MESTFFDDEELLNAGLMPLNVGKKPTGAQQSAGNVANNYSRHISASSCPGEPLSCVPTRDSTNSKTTPCISSQPAIIYLPSGHTPVRPERQEKVGEGRTWAAGGRASSDSGAPPVALSSKGQRTADTVIDLVDSDDDSCELEIVGRLAPAPCKDNAKNSIPMKPATGMLSQGAPSSSGSSLPSAAPQAKTTACGGKGTSSMGGKAASSMGPSRRPWAQSSLATGACPSQQSRADASGKIQPPASTAPAGTSAPLEGHCMGRHQWDSVAPDACAGTPVSQSWSPPQHPAPPLSFYGDIDAVVACQPALSDDIGPHTRPSDDDGLHARPLESRAGAGSRRRDDEPRPGAWDWEHGPQAACTEGNGAHDRDVTAVKPVGASRLYPTGLGASILQPISKSATASSGWDGNLEAHGSTGQVRGRGDDSGTLQGAISLLSSSPSSSPSLSPSSSPLPSRSPSPLRPRLPSPCQRVAPPQAGTTAGDVILLPYIPGWQPPSHPPPQLPRRRMRPLPDDNDLDYAHDVNDVNNANPPVVDVGEESPSTSDDGDFACGDDGDDANGFDESVCRHVAATSASFPLTGAAAGGGESRAWNNAYPAELTMPGGTSAFGAASLTKEAPATGPEAKRRKVAADKAAAREAKEAAKREKAEAREKERARKAAEKEERREELRRNREAAKADKEREKENRGAERDLRRRLGGRDAAQDITIMLDTGVVAKEKLGCELLRTLDETEYPREVRQNKLPSTVEWQRRRTLLDGRVIQERIAHVAVLYGGEEFGRLLYGREPALDACVRRVVDAYPGHVISLVVCGLNAYLRSCKQKEWKSGGSGAGAPDLDTMLAHLTVGHGGAKVKHFLAVDAADAADHVVQLAKYIAQAPYRTDRKFLKVFGSAHASVTRAMDCQDYQGGSWAAMLNTIPGNGDRSSRAIARSFPSLKHLMDAYQRLPDEQARVKLLANLDKEAPTDTVQYSHRKVGDAAARKVLALLTATDPCMPFGASGAGGPATGPDVAEEVLHDAPLE